VMYDLDKSERQVMDEETRIVTLCNTFDYHQGDKNGLVRRFTFRWRLWVQEIFINFQK